MAKGSGFPEGRAARHGRVVGQRQASEVLARRRLLLPPLAALSELRLLVVLLAAMDRRPSREGRQAVTRPELASVGVEPAGADF